MRIALISDIHGHDIALEAVLADIETQMVDQIICLGDVATIGPQPKAVLARLRTLDCPGITGNHDAALLDLTGALDYETYRIAPPLIPDLRWCAQQLDQDDIDYLQSFKPTMTVSLGSEATLCCFHGSPQSYLDPILATTPDEELEALLAGHTATVMAGGHAHIQMLRQYRGVFILNAGSVGHPFREIAPPGAYPTLLPWAEYALVTWSQSVLSVDLRRVSFDQASFIQVVSTSDLAVKGWLLQQYNAWDTDTD